MKLALLVSLILISGAAQASSEMICTDETGQTHTFSRFGNTTILDGRLLSPADRVSVRPQGDGSEIVIIRLADENRQLTLNCR